MTPQHFDSLIQQYLTDEGRFLARRTMQERKEQLDNFHGWLVGGVDFAPEDLPERIRTCTDWMLHSGLSKNTVIGRREILRCFFQWAVEGKHWPLPNPVQPIRTLCAQPPNRRGMTQAEMETLVNHKWLHTYWPMAIRVGWATGLRLADVALLSSEMLVSEGNPYLWLVPRKGRRFGKHLAIPISHDLAERLDECNKFTGGGYFFPGMASRYLRDARKTLSSQFAVGVKRCGLSGISFHSLRHGAVSRLLEQGTPAAVVASITGHSLQVMARYSHPSMEAKREALGV